MFAGLVFIHLITSVLEGILSNTREERIGFPDTKNWVGSVRQSERDWHVVGNSIEVLQVTKILL